MGDCPGAGSGDSRDYENRSSAEIKRDEYNSAVKWIKSKGFLPVRIGQPESGEHFVNVKLRDRYLGYFVYIQNEDIKIIQAELTRLYGTEKYVPNYDENYEYFIVKKKMKKSEEARMEYDDKFSRKGPGPSRR